MGVLKFEWKNLKAARCRRDLFLLDVRDEFEYEISNIGGQLIPLAELAKRVNELDVNRNIVTICKMGPRGLKRPRFCIKQDSLMLESDWRIHAWSDRVDKSVRKY